MDSSTLKKQIFSLFEDNRQANFELLAMETFRIQSNYNIVYRQYLDALGADIRLINTIEAIPLMPVSFFKNHRIKTAGWEEEAVFKSSGTASGHRSHHHIRDLGWYHMISRNIFTRAIGDPAEYSIIAVLPSYLENGDSGLVNMVGHFIGLNKGKKGGFYKYNFEEIEAAVTRALAQDEKVLLFGVAFALLDMVKSCQIDSERLTVMFTGGMKGRGEEKSFSEIVSGLKEGFPSSGIYSEYGMTEMHSQAYAGEDGIFHSGALMRIMPREITDPLTAEKGMRAAQVGIIDLGNVDTVSFLLTEDLGRDTPNGFTLLGRMQNSEMRGCNLLYLE